LQIGMPCKVSLTFAQFRACSRAFYWLGLMHPKTNGL
jgi:hypothetical protein